MKDFSLLNHVMVPYHEIIDNTELTFVLEKYSIEKEQLPKIKNTDPVIKEIEAKVGDVIKITRKSATAGEAVVYKLVTE